MVCPECMKIQADEQCEVHFDLRSNGDVTVRARCDTCGAKWRGTLKRQGRKLIRPAGAGRQLTTGKFETREELIQNVVELVDILSLSFTVVGRKCGVSDQTARKLYDEHWRTVGGLTQPAGCFKCHRLHPKEEPCGEAQS